MPSAEEPAAAAGLRPINCSPSSPSHKVLRELQVTDESGGARGSMDASASEKCSEGGEGETDRAGDEGEEREEAGRWQLLLCLIQTSPGG